MDWIFFFFFKIFPWTAQWKRDLLFCFFSFPFTSCSVAGFKKQEVTHILHNPLSPGSSRAVPAPRLTWGPWDSASTAKPGLSAGWPDAGVTFRGLGGTRETLTLNLPGEMSGVCCALTSLTQSADALSALALLAAAEAPAVGTPVTGTVLVNEAPV